MTKSPTPAQTSVSLSPKKSEEERCQEPYREAVGGLMTWIANATGSDIANAAGEEVARQAHDPGAKQWRVVLRIIEYLRGTREKGIVYKRSPASTLTAYANSIFG